MRSVRLFSALVMGIGAVSAWPALAQQVTVGTPYHTLSDSFFENTGVGWGMNWKNGFVRFGGSPLAAAPQFGGFAPGAGFNTGWGFGGDGYNGHFNMAASQGNRRSFVSQTPSITLTHGQPGFISDSSVSPFVMGYVPIVAGIPTVPPPYSTMSYPGYSMAPAMQPTSSVNPAIAAYRQQMANREPGVPAVRPAQARPAVGRDLNLVAEAAIAPDDSAARALAAAQSSSAGRAVPSVAEARRLRQLEQTTRQNEALALFQRGRTAEEAGKTSLAKIFYNMAAKKADSQLNDRIRARIDAIDAPDAR